MDSVNHNTRRWTWSPGRRAGDRDDRRWRPGPAAGRGRLPL